jgi:hypothetical protein
MEPEAAAALAALVVVPNTETDVQVSQKLRLFCGGSRPAGS